MAKKNFLDNPALKFINIPQEQHTSDAGSGPTQEPDQVTEPQTRFE